MTRDEHIRYCLYTKGGKWEIMAAISCLSFGQQVYMTSIIEFLKNKYIKK
jgi:hypothetical protein